MPPTYKICGFFNMATTPTKKNICGGYTQQQRSLLFAWRFIKLCLVLVLKIAWVTAACTILFLLISRDFIVCLPVQRTTDSICYWCVLIFRKSDIIGAGPTTTTTHYSPNIIIIITIIAHTSKQFFRCHHDKIFGNPNTSTLILLTSPLFVSNVLLPAVQSAIEPPAAVVRKDRHIGQKVLVWQMPGGNKDERI